MKHGCSIASLTLFLFFSLVLHLHFETTMATRTSLKVFGTLNTLDQSPTSTPNDQFEIKNIEQNAFRPTLPGPSQGIGHRTPPALKIIVWNAYKNLILYRCVIYRKSMMIGFELRPANFFEQNPVLKTKPIKLTTTPKCTALVTD
ncbi:hypothetical protein EUTSA_v10009664mg [Eutrema salsugineum]|uniref:Uncharacterized protein n=1 Tax=Eutrema salsugineum TaxID=72664 RepID=V4KUF6_EUTSA|nr:hypothetical protein EUTSA_v10009664mg [Eutrema salsugineum]